MAMGVGIVGIGLFLLFLFAFYSTIMSQINKMFTEALSDIFAEGEMQELAWSGLHNKK